MDNQKAIEILRKFQKKCDELRDDPELAKSKKFMTFRHDLETSINYIFNEDRKNIYLNKFNKINFTPYVYGGNTDYRIPYLRGLNSTQALLESMINELTDYGTISTEKLSDNSPERSISYIEKISNRFHRIAIQLRNRYANRSTIDINDEYDVQDLFHSLLHIYFDDIRPEEWTPSYAGKSSRTDFLLKEQEIFIEIKKTRKDHNAGKIGDELSIDIAHYKEHSNCKHLICFIYDPDGRITNPKGLISDLERQSDTAMTVKVIINPVY